MGSRKENGRQRARTAVEAKEEDDGASFAEKFANFDERQTRTKPLCSSLAAQYY